MWRSCILYVCFHWLPSSEHYVQGLWTCIVFSHPSICFHSVLYFLWQAETGGRLCAVFLQPFLIHPCFCGGLALPQPPVCAGSLEAAHGGLPGALSSCPPREQRPCSREMSRAESQGRNEDVCSCAGWWAGSPLLRNTVGMSHWSSWGGADKYRAPLHSTVG